MQEAPKKTYTLEDNIKSIFFQNKDILKAIAEIKQEIASLRQDKNGFDGSQF